MKPILIATFAILCLGLGPVNKAQAQLVYGYSVPPDDGGTDSSSSYSSGGYSPGSSGYSGMMSTRGYTGSSGYNGLMYPWGNSPWNSKYSPWSTTGSSRSFQGTSNQMWSNQWNGFGSRSGFSQPGMSMSPTGMNSGLGGMMNMGMRRR